MIVSIHIPKTAGTSLAYVLDIGSDRAIMYDYSKDYSNKTFTDHKRDLFRGAIPFIEENFRFIHGHFYLEKYQDLLPNAKYVTCFRHPVKRIISQYQHIAMERDEKSPAFQFIRKGASVVDFAERDINVRNAHLVHLGGVPPSELDYIFLAEDFPTSVRLFIKSFPDYIPNSWVSPQNVNTKAQRVSMSKESPSALGLVTEADIVKLQNVAKDDVVYYQSAYSQYHIQKKKILNGL